MKILLALSVAAFGLIFVALPSETSAAPAEGKKTEEKKSEVDLAFDAFNKLREKPEAKYDAAEFDALGRAGIEFLKTYPTHRRAVVVVRNMAEYDRKIQAPNKQATPAMRTMYARQVSLLISNQPSDLTPQVEVALAALRASMAGVVARAEPTKDNITAWTERIDKMQAMQGSGPFLADQLIAPYLFFKERRLPIAESYLNSLLDHENSSVASRAKEEAALAALETTPLDLSFTAMNGKPFSAESIRGTKILVVHFFTLKSQGNLAEIDTVCAEFGKKVEVIGICLEPAESASAVSKMLSAERIRWPVLHDGLGKENTLAKALGIRDSSNTVVFKVDGLMHQRGVGSGRLREQIDRLLATKKK